MQRYQRYSMSVGMGNEQEAVIPRFYFPLRCGDEGVSPDEFGLDFPDVESAYLEADRAVRDMARELRAKGKDPRSYAFEITSASGEVVFELLFSETLDRQKDRRQARLQRTVAVNRAETMLGLTAEVAEQTRRVLQNLQRTRDLLSLPRPHRRLGSRP